MKIPVICKVCGDSVRIRGHYEPDTNATVLSDYDKRWDDACEHIKAGGDYDLGTSDVEDEDGSYETTDHGDRVWPY